MENVLILLAVAGILGIAIGYIVKAKKRGQHCIGCPHGGDCEKCRTKNK